MKPYQHISPRSPKLLSRRHFLSASATLPLGTALLSAPAASALLSDPASAVGTRSSFLIEGKPRFLAAGSMDYFRCPADQWRDRILKAKRAGLNTIMTYVAWNQHEPEEGRFVFTGRSNIKRFLEHCAELEMLAVVRVGPFICDEFEAGGHPAWLIGKPGVVLRVRSEIADPCIERWFQHLCQQIAPLQSTAGGPVVIMVQAENEYYYADRPGGLAYLDFLFRTLRSNGITVPITGCGNGDELQSPLYFSTINGYGPETAANFRRKHPDAPLLTSEHYTDWMDVWTWPATDFPKRPMLEQESIDALSKQVMLSYFCFHGGTNFGFTGASTWKSDHSWVTTRYWAQGPIAEGGALNPNYFAAKSASLPIARFEEFFVAARPASLPVLLDGPVIGRALRSAAGTFIFTLPLYPISADQRYLPDDADRPVAMVEDRPSIEIDAAAGAITLPNGSRLPLAAGSVRSLILPYNFRIDDRTLIDFANACLLGVGGGPGRRVVLLWGEPGREGHVSINGTPVSFLFPEEQPHELEIAGIVVLALSSEMADRTWFADGRVIVGPAFVGERSGAQHTCLLDERSRHLLVVEHDGTIQRTSGAQKIADASPLPPRAPLVWTHVRLPEPRSENGWRTIDVPRSVEELGAFYGYTWYRAQLPHSDEPRSSLLFTSLADRAHVWIDGRYAGVCGRGRDAQGDLLTVELTPGNRSVTMLVDNMGRWSEGSTQQRKGILGPVYAGAQLEQQEVPTLAPSAVPAETSWQFRKFKTDAGPQAHCFSAHWSLQTHDSRDFFLALRRLPQYAWVYVEGKLIGEHHGDNSLLDGFAASEYILPSSAHKGPLELKIIFFGSVPDMQRSIYLYSFDEHEALHAWAFRAWLTPSLEEHATSPPDDEKEPCWWQTSFPKPTSPGPFFLATQGLSKGQVFLNGEATGRYWQLGPQYDVFLPEETMLARNTLAVLEESGRSPAQTSIFRDENVPTRTVQL